MTCQAKHTCPECLAGKHRNCRGDAWCFVDDNATGCDCDHKPRGSGAAT